MTPDILQSPRIEQFLDVCFLSGTELSIRVPGPVLVLEMTPQTLQRKLGIATHPTDPEPVSKVWDHIAALRKRGMRLRSDSVVRFVFLLHKPNGGADGGISVGRSRRNDISVSDGRISARHAFFARDQFDQYVLVDTGARNRSEVNGVRLQPHGKATLRPGDRIGFGSYTFVFLPASDFQRYVSSLIENIQPTVEF